MSSYRLVNCDAITVLASRVKQKIDNFDDNDEYLFIYLVYGSNYIKLIMKIDLIGVIKHRLQRDTVAL